MIWSKANWTDEDRKKAIAAIQQITHQNELWIIATTTNDPFVCAAAAERLEDEAKLLELSLMGNSDLIDDCDPRLIAVKCMKEEKNLLKTVLNSPCHEIRRAALHRIDDKSLLTQVVIHGKERVAAEAYKMINDPYRVTKRDKEAMSKMLRNEDAHD